MELRDVRVVFDDKVVFDHHDFTFPDSGVTMLVGASGAGKTTLLRALREKYPERGFLFQEDRLFPRRTVLQHLLDVMDEPNAARAAELLELVELRGEEGSYPDQLSGGMARRLALARCLALGRAGYLLDEPFAGVDEPTQLRILERLKALGVPILFSSHNQQLREKADAVVCL